ncbi:MAG: V-type ATP synthase subunit I [Clostridia bacterium]|nr:V-type ATP synthase subunit I [Clostridia bacterium]
MAVAEMQKLNLAALAYDRDKILNSLQWTGATEIKLHPAAELTFPLEADCGDLREYCNSAEAALGFLCAEVENYIKENKIKTDVLGDGFDVSYSEFIGAGKYKEQADALIAEINSLIDKRRSLSAEKSKLLRTQKTAEIYSCIKRRLGDFADTKHTVIKLGTLPSSEADAFLKEVCSRGLCDCKVISSDAETALVIFAAHKSEEQIDGLLQSAGFSACPFQSDKTGEEVYNGVCVRIDEIDSLLDGVKEKLYGLGKNIKQFKVYCDYLAFELEKLSQTEKMRGTAKTFFLEAYVPKDAEELIKQTLDGVTSAVYYEFSEPDEDETPPTLYKNNAVVKNFETITNMYSPANSREFDPNTVMAFFYSLFLGFIMADMGYGALMILGGGAIYLKTRKKDGGITRLSAVFAIGGIFAVIWGALFGSLFGVEMFRSVMPNAQSDMWSFMGIRVPAVLVISLELGVVQLLTGYVCRAIQCMRRGRFWDGILDGLVWVVFSLGVGLAVAGLIDELKFPRLALVGGIMAGAALVVAIFTAGRKEKLLGKFTKGFGAAYGIINYASDVLSYARLYGLMLSGAVIAKIISDYAVVGVNGGTGFILSGNPMLVILGVVLLIVGHGFNLAIGLLGAYIHDARLQYVEFYGRFFEGEGELFAPLGSNQKYVKVVKTLQPTAD